MKYITKGQLAGYSPTARDIIDESVKRETYEAFADKKPANSVFLSHSHKDRELVLRVKKFLQSQGVGVYIDWLDDGMPEETSAATAEKIKEKIESNRKFAVIVTEYSKASHWVPWELGYADKAKSLEHVLLVPVSEDDREFSGAEYLQIYFCLERYKERWVVWRNTPPKLTALEDWIKN